jgi:hypothetical protein
MTNKTPIQLPGILFITICLSFVLIFSSAIKTQAIQSQPAEPADPQIIVEDLGVTPVESTGLRSLFPSDSPGLHIGPVQPELDENGEYIVDLQSIGLTDFNQPAETQATYLYENVDTNSCRGVDLAIDLDRNGRPHLLYHDNCSNNIIYAVRDEVGWQRTGFSLGNSVIGTHLDLVLDDYDYPHLVFYDSTGTRLWYGSIDNFGFWFFEVVDDSDDSGSHCSIALDRFGRVHVSYFLRPYEDLMHKMRDSSGWHRLVETVDSYYRGAYSSIATDSNGYPHFSYADEMLGNLRYAWQESADAWHSETLDPKSGTGTRNSLAIDSYDQPHVSYYDSQNTDVKYGYKDDLGWHFTRFADKDLDSGTFNSLALDSEDHPYISFWDDTGNDLYLAYNLGGGWQFDRVYDGNSQQIHLGWNDLSLDRYGNPVMGYRSTDPDVQISYLEEPDLDIPDYLTGWKTPVVNERDVNRCATDVIGQFRSLRDHGEVMGFNLNEHPYPRYDIYDITPYWHNHWQGIQRLTAGNGTLMVLTQDEIRRPVNCGSDICEEKTSGFAIVELATRMSDIGPDYENFTRLRSNRLNPVTDYDDTPPSASDGVVKTVYLSADYDHVGGIQALGQWLAVSLEAGDPTRAIVDLYDLTYYPPALNQDAVRIPGVETLVINGSTGTATALTKLADGRYLLAVHSTRDGGGLDFFISYAPHSLAPENGRFLRFLPLDHWSSSELLLDPMVDFEFPKWDPYQSINFITQCGLEGAIYLVGTGNLESFCNPLYCTPDGPDVADLYRLTIESGQVKMTRVAQRHFYCNWNGVEGQCNFDAAAGVYVNESGQLYLYSAEHANDGPRLPGQQNDSVKFMEYRPVPHSGCDNINTAWVELYDNTFFDKTLGKGLMIDYIDRELENYSDYDNTDAFNNSAEAVRWCLPLGWSYRVYDKAMPVGSNPCSGKWFTLYGNNQQYVYADLSKIGRADMASCSYFAIEAPSSAGVTASGAKLIWIFRSGGGNIPEGSYLAPSADDLTTTIDFPAGGLSANSTATYTPQTPTDIPEGSMLVGSHGFYLNLEPQVSFMKPAEITIQFSDLELDELYPATMNLYYFDPLGSWVEASATCGDHNPPVIDLQAKWIKTHLCKPGSYALFAEREYYNYLPVVKR